MDKLKDYTLFSFWLKYKKDLKDGKWYRVEYNRHIVMRFRVVPSKDKDMFGRARFRIYIECYFNGDDYKIIDFNGHENMNVKLVKMLDLAWEECKKYYT